MSITSNRLFQLFKYAVYALLAFNIYVFWSEEFLASAVQFPDGVRIFDYIDAFAATIDTAAWVILLLMFELETFVLEERQFTRSVTWTLHGIRFLCYAFIIYAFYGYVVNLVFILQATHLAGVSNLCTLVADGWTYVIDLDEYAQITAANCTSFSDATTFLRFFELPAAVDASGLRAVTILAWVDVINAGVWLLVVVVLEMDVWLQERNRLEGAIVKVSSSIKYALYSVLLLAAIYWGIKGDFIDFWDAFLWLVAFALIELNVFEWRQEVNEATSSGEITASS